MAIVTRYVGRFIYTFEESSATVPSIRSEVTNVVTADTAFSLNKPSGSVTGDEFLITIALDGTGHSLATPSGFTSRTDAASGGDTTTSMSWCWTKTVDGTEAASVSYTTAANEAWAGRYLCIQDTGGIDTGAFAEDISSSNRLTATLPSVTVADANSLGVLTVYCEDADTVISVPAGWTRYGSDVVAGTAGTGDKLATFTKTLAAGATGTVTVTQSLSQEMILGLVVYKPVQLGGTLSAGLSAVLSKAFQTAAGLSAAIQKTGNTQNLSVSAVLAKIQSQQAALSSALQKQQQLSASLNLAAQKTGLVQTASLSSALAKQQTANVSVNAALQKTQSATAGLQAALRKNFTITTALSTALSKQFTASFGISASLISGAGITVSASLNLAAQKNQTVSAAASAAIAKIQAQTTSVQNVLAKVNAVVAAQNAALQKTSSASTSLQAALAKAQKPVHSVNAVLAKVTALQASLNLAAQKLQSVSANFSVVLISASVTSVSASLNVVAAALVKNTAQLSVALLKLQQNQTALSTALQKKMTAAFVLDGAFAKTTPRQLALQGLISGKALTSHQFNAGLLGQRSSTLGLSVALISPSTAPQSRTFRAAAPKREVIAPPLKKPKAQKPKRTVNAPPKPVFRAPPRNN